MAYYTRLASRTPFGIVSDLEPYQSARKLFGQRKFAEAFAIYEQLANQGDHRSQVFLGWMYCEGIGVARNANKGYALLSQVARLGSKEGAFYCGRYALSGGRLQESIDWFRIGASQDYGPALLWLGLAHIRGTGVEVDFSKGVEYLKRAAKNGNYLALREIGLLMLTGRLGPSKIPLGLLVVPYAIVAGIIAAIGNPDSDRLLS